ncbi:phosphatidylserine decarboxylase [Halobaculum sp. MBLA0147]|uniref:phosphatidylserine decarboxylase n=1 Tax=Halobaculum sp. MBLA0147 TaxID=3079934 RepID=UPI0035267319
MAPTAIAAPERTDGEYGEVTLELLGLLERDPRAKRALEQSIDAAASANSDPDTNPVRSLDDYYRFVDRTVDLVPRDVLENPENLLRDEIQQTICYFYFLVGQEVDALRGLEGYDLYRPAPMYYPPFSNWLRTYADAWGQFLDTEASWNRRIYREFYADERFGLQEDWYETPAAWDSFNDFFARHLRTPDVRPIASGDDVVSAPADSVPQGVWRIEDDLSLGDRVDPHAPNGGGGGGSGETDGDHGTESDGGVRIKNRSHQTVSDLLGESDYADAFAGGRFTHTFLNVNDYHRYHFPVSGVVREHDTFEQNVAIEAHWDGDAGRYGPVDTTGWQFTQTRGYVIVETDTVGVVALVPIGMAEVSDVYFADPVESGRTFRKGDPLGHFLFGGSDFAMLFDSEANFELTDAYDDDADQYEHLLMGEAYGHVDA